jgi:hypothetical protein
VSQQETTNTNGIADFEVSTTNADTYIFTASLDTVYYDTSSYIETPTLINNYDGTASTLVSGSQGDNVETTIMLPFDFNLYNQNVSAGDPLYVCSNGFISLISTGCPTSGSLTNSIAGFFTDLDTTNGGIYIDIAPDSNSATLLWDAVEQETNNLVMFEIILYRNNRVDFHYFANPDLTPRIGLYNGTGGTNPTNESIFDNTAVNGSAATKFENTETTGIVNLAQTSQVEFMAGAVDTENSSVTVSQSSIPANGSTNSVITVILKDAYNNPITDRTVEIRDNVNPGQIRYLTSFPPHTEDKTDSTGTAVFTANSVVAGIVTFEAKDQITSTSIGITTIDFSCILSTNQQCLQIKIEPDTGTSNLFEAAGLDALAPAAPEAGGVLTLTAPDNFSFETIYSSINQQQRFSINSPTPYTHNVNDIVTVTDTEENGGFLLQLQASSFTDGSNTIPLAGFYAVTQPSRTDGIQIDGVEYPSGYAGITNITAPQDNLVGGALDNTSTFTTYGENLDTIIDLMQAPIKTGEVGRNGTFKQNVQYYLVIPAAQSIGSYQTTLTFDLTRTAPI